MRRRSVILYSHALLTLGGRRFEYSGSRYTKNPLTCEGSAQGAGNGAYALANYEYENIRHGLRIPQGPARATKMRFRLTIWPRLGRAELTTGLFDCSIRRAGRSTMVSVETMPEPENTNGSYPTAHHVVRSARLAHQSRAVLRLGMLLLAAGASAYRVKHAMQQLAVALGIEDTHAAVTFTEITLTCYAGGTFRTETAEQRAMGTNAERIDTLVNWVNSLPPAILVEEANVYMDQVSASPPRYGRALLMLITGFACACFCFLNRGGIVECSTVFFAAAAGQFLRSTLMRRLWNTFGVWFLCGLLSCGIYVGLVACGVHFGWISAAHQAGVVSAILFLIPGFPLVTALLDLLRADFTAGLTRVTYVSILLLAAATAVWSIVTLFSWETAATSGYELPGGVLWAARFGATFVASFGFAMLFQANPAACALAGLNAALINPVRLYAQDAGVMPAFACLIAALAAGLFAHALSLRTRHSRVSLSVPSVVVMIPGTAIMRATRDLVDGNTVAALSSWVQVLLAIGAIGVGLAAARMFTDRTWLMEPPHSLVGPLGDSRTTLTPAVLTHVRACNASGVPGRRAAASRADTAQNAQDNAGPAPESEADVTAPDSSGGPRCKNA